MFKKLIALVLTGTMVMALAGCGSEKQESLQASTQEVTSESTQESTDGQTRVFKLSHNFLNTQPMHTALAEVAKNIEERTNGEIKIEVYENAQIANGVDGVEQCIRGADFINVYDASCMGDWVKDYNALVGPFLYDSQEEYSEFCKGEFAQSLNAQAEEQGIKVLALDYCFGFRHIGTNKKEITSFDDMKGFKIRVPKSTVWVETFQSLGASPTAMGWSEIYNGLQTNVIEGMESSISDIYDNQLWEVLNNITLSKHFLGTAAVMMSAEVYHSLTPEQQEIITEEFAKGAAVNNELADIAEEEARAAMEEKGINFIEIDLAPFKEASKAYFENMPGLSENVYDKIMKDLEAIRNK